MVTAKKASPKPMHARGSYKFLRVCKLHFPDPIVRDIAFAYDLSKYGHHKQRRTDDSRYFEHPRAIALILMKELNIYDCDLVISILLHDVPEDSFLLDQHRINRVFGNSVSQIVWLMTKLKSHKGRNVIKYFRRLVQSSNWRAIFCKCLDRLHNMRTLEGSSREKKLKQVKETREMILPLVDVLEKIVPRVYKTQLFYVKKCLTNLCNHYDTSDQPPKLTKKMIV